MLVSIYLIYFFSSIYIYSPCWGSILMRFKINIKEDVLSKVLGPENRGRLQGMGGRVFYTKYFI